jgi:hypothetical protein
MKKRELRDRSVYRRQVSGAGLVPFEVAVKETDLMIMAEKDLTDEARELVLTLRFRLEEYIARHPPFLTALGPVDVPATAPAIVKLMSEGAEKAGVGPMAAVAGAVAESVGKGLLPHSSELIIENGGDIYLAGARERTVAIFTGEAEIGSRIGVTVRAAPEGIGVCTSSGRFGHSLSLGEASTATVIAPSTALADAAATAVGNSVLGDDGIEQGMETARGIEGITGAVIVQGGRVGAWGDIELTGIARERT